MTLTNCVSRKFGYASVCRPCESFHPPKPSPWPTWVIPVVTLMVRPHRKRKKKKKKSRSDPVSPNASFFRRHRFQSSQPRPPAVEELVGARGRTGTLGQPESNQNGAQSQRNPEVEASPAVCARSRDGSRLPLQMWVTGCSVILPNHAVSSLSRRAQSPLSNNSEYQESIIKM